MISDVILNIYFLSLLIVGLFSVETFYLTYQYWRNKRGKPSLAGEDYMPVVTVQLPIYNEEYVAERLIKSVCQLNYPCDKLEIQVLDDSTDGTYGICADLTHFYRKQGFNITHLHRQNRTGFKAGALREGLEVACGELIAIFDADFIPNPSFLKQTVPYFQDTKIGMVQTRWDHLNENYSLLTKAQAFGLAGHFVIEQNGRNAAGFFINFNGTAGVWRKECIQDAGNWQDDTLTEDLDLSYRAQIKGWKFVFLNEVVTPAELPAEINALKSQQYRWTKGAVETAKKILPLLWKSKIPLKIKIHSTFHLTNNMVYPFILILAVLNLPIIVIKNEVPQSGLYFAIFAFFIISFASSFLFYAISQYRIYQNWIKRLWLFPLFMSGSMGLSLNNTIAVIQAFLATKTPFIRTPKYRIIGKEGSFIGKHYFISLDKTVFMELLMAVYCCIAVILGFYYFEFGILPFLIMFFAGYSIIGYLSVRHYLSLKYRRV